jgi:hypothetical protein
MTQLARIPAAAVPPSAGRPQRRWLSGWWAKPFLSLLRAWRSQTDLFERWYAAPYKDGGPLRWQRREGTYVLDGVEVPSHSDRKGNR